MLKQILIDFLNLLFPVRCVSCGECIEGRHSVICDECLSKIQITDYHLYPNTNRLWMLMNTNVDIKYAYALFKFHQNDIVKKLIHYMKYKNHPEIGVQLGILYGSILKKHHCNIHFDVIIPVPLHKKRIEQRGYNQSEMFAKGLSQIINIPVNDNCIFRTVNTISQTTKSGSDRLLGMDNVFTVVDMDEVKGKRVLIVDDVVTTGSTMTSCIKALKVNLNCEVSVAVIAIAE